MILLLLLLLLLFYYYYYYSIIIIIICPQTCCYVYVKYVDLTFRLLAFVVHERAFHYIQKYPFQGFQACISLANKTLIPILK